MAERSSSFPAMVWAILIKDIQSELRNRYAINALVMFSIITLTAVSFSVGQEVVGSGMEAPFLWIVIFFSAMAGLGQSFIKEEETGTVLALRMNSSALPVFWSKLLFNTMILICLEIILIPAFFIFLTVTCRNTGLFITVILLGTLGLTGATTIIAAIISKASMKGALFAVLSFPVLLPVLISAIGGTETAFEGGSFGDAMGNLKMLIAYPVIMITVSIFLFEYIWND